MGQSKSIRDPVSVRKSSRISAFSVFPEPPVFGIIFELVFFQGRLSDLTTPPFSSSLVSQHP